MARQGKFDMLFQLLQHGVSVVEETTREWLLYPVGDEKLCDRVAFDEMTVSVSGVEEITSSSGIIPDDESVRGVSDGMTVSVEETPDWQKVSARD